jgi:hypothetical protein
MKKILLATLIINLGFNAFCQTAITLDRTDFPCPTTASCGADSVQFTNVPLVGNGIDLNQISTNSTWSYANLSSLGTDFARFIPASQAPIVFQLAFFGSDFVNPLLGSLSVANLPISDAYEYYNYSVGNTRLEIKGFGANVTIPGQTIALPLPAVYSSPDVLYKFPVQFGNTDSSSSGFSLPLTIPNLPAVTIKRAQKRVNVVDAWGSMTTPAGTFNVLRVKSSITRIDSFINTFLPIGVPTNIVEYKWIAKGKKIPVLQVNTTSTTIGNPTISSVSYWGTAPLSIFDWSNSASRLHLFPNPSHEVTNIEFDTQHIGKTTLDIVAINGAIVGHYEFLLQGKKHIESIPLFGLQAGNYVLISNSNGKASTQKLRIQ